MTASISHSGHVAKPWTVAQVRYSDFYADPSAHQPQRRGVRSARREIEVCGGLLDAVTLEVVFVATRATLLPLTQARASGPTPEQDEARRSSLRLCNTQAAQLIADLQSVCGTCAPPSSRTSDRFGFTAALRLLGARALRRLWPFSSRDLPRRHVFDHLVLARFGIL